MDEASAIASTSGSPADAAPLVKVKRARNRARLSCAECRRLKLKCSRDWPCTSCTRRGCAELCPDGVSKPPGRSIRIQAEMNALVQRIDELSTMVQKLGGSLPPKLVLEFAGKGAIAVAGGSKEGEAKVQGNGGGPMGPSEGDSAMHDDEEDEEEEESLLSQGVGSLSIRDEDGRTRFLGVSAGSAYYFKDDDDSPSSEEEGPASPASQITRLPYIQLGTAYSRSHELDRLRAFLPHSEEVERLCKNYWSYLAFQFQPIEEEVFWDDYLPCAMSAGNTQGAKLASVFIILSLGSLMDPRAPSTPNANAAQYFQLTLATLSASRYLSHNTLCGVQTLQLCANYLLNTHDLQEGGETLWPLLGQGIKQLVSMGLHRDGSKWGLEETELRRRRTVFYEFITLERMQSFVSGRPYMMAPNHFDTEMPPDAEPYNIGKWTLGNFIARVIDQAFSVTPPSYTTVTTLDEELRALFKDSPSELRSGALPATAFVVRPTGPPVLPEESLVGGTLKNKMRCHTLDMIFSQIFFYLHLPALRQALSLYPEEPLRSPWASSVAVVSLETGVYMLALAKSWVALHPVLCPRWWHIFFHAFAASVAQSSIVIKSPNSVLAPHAWAQLAIAIDVFETASTGGAPVSMFVPRLKSLRDTAFLSLQNAQSVPRGLATSQVSDFLAEGTDANLSILGPTTRLERKPRKRLDDSRSSASPTSILSSILLNAPPPTPAPADNPLPTTSSASADQVYTPFDSPVLTKYGTPFDAGALGNPSPAPTQPHHLSQSPYMPTVPGPFQFRPPPTQHAPQLQPQLHPHAPSHPPPSQPPSGSQTPVFPTDPSTMAFTNFATAIPGVNFPQAMWPAGATFGAPELSNLAASAGVGTNPMAGLDDQWMWYNFGMPPPSS